MKDVLHCLDNIALYGPIFDCDMDGGSDDPTT